MSKYTLVGQKFKIGDKVYKKNIFGSTKGIEKRVGSIYGVFTKKNSKGSHHYYYNIQWDDGKRSENAQHGLVDVNNTAAY